MIKTRLTIHIWLKMVKTRLTINNKHTTSNKSELNSA